MDESLRACRSSSSTRADKRSSCAVSAPPARSAPDQPVRLRQPDRQLSGRQSRQLLAEGTPATVTTGNDHHSGQPINNLPGVSPPRNAGELSVSPLGWSDHPLACPHGRPGTRRLATCPDKDRAARAPRVQGPGPYGADRPVRLTGGGHLRRRLPAA